MKLLFVHGWGFDGGLWRDVIARLPEFETLIEDRGYFGHPAAPEVDGPCAVIAHSHGAMRALLSPPADMRGLIAINGFDRFDVPRRILDRMITRFAEAPSEVLADFRQRCGTTEPAPAFDAPLLLQDLHGLRDDDASGPLNIPVLSLQGANDAIFPPALHVATFAQAPVTRATHPDADHLMPLAQPQWCADAIRAFVERTA